MVRPPCCDEKKGIWSVDEDVKILTYVSKHGTGNWSNLPKKAGFRRRGKSCRLRWNSSCQRPEPKHDSFTPQEEELIVKLHATIGSRWSMIAQQLPGRTDNEVKNYWNTKLRKKLADMGIDHVTHKPYSQILADYGSLNVDGLLKSGTTRISSLNKDLKNAFSLKPDQYSSSSTTEGIASINNDPHLTVTSEVENNISYCTNNCNHSTDLLDQLQAIKLVTQASYNKLDSALPNFTNEGLASMSSSSSCSSSTVGQEKSTVSCSWRDFLLEDALLPTEQQEQGVEFSSQAQNYVTTQTRNVEGIDLAGHSNGFPDPSSSHSSFVQAILDRENEIFLDFPANILDETFYY